MQDLWVSSSYLSLPHTHFSEFFGLSGSLDTSFNRSKTFYLIFLVQLVLAGIIVSFPNVSLFHLVIGSQVLNAMMLPFVFYYLLKLTNNRDIMGNFVNKPIQRSLGTFSVVVISIASVFGLVLALIK